MSLVLHDADIVVGASEQLRVRHFDGPQRAHYDGSAPPLCGVRLAHDDGLPVLDVFLAL